MTKNICLLSFFFLFTSNNLIGQDFVYAIRSNAYTGYTLISESGEVLMSLPILAEPIFDDISRTGTYPNKILIPLNKDNFPLRYGTSFFIVNINGEIVKKLHPNTEWVHAWASNSPRISLINYPSKGQYSDLFIDEMGTVKFDEEIFSEAQDFHMGKALIKPMDEKSWSLINVADDSRKEIFENESRKTDQFNLIFNGIWSYMQKPSYKEWFIAENGSQDTSVQKLIERVHGLKIPSLLLKNTSNSLAISQFLFETRHKHILLTTKNDEGEYIQALYDRNLNKIQIVQPNIEGRYIHLISSTNFIFGNYQPHNNELQQVYVVIDRQKNTVLHQTDNSIIKVGNFSFLQQEDEHWDIRNMNNEPIFSSKDLAPLKYAKIDFTTGKKRLSATAEILLVEGYEGEALDLDLEQKYPHVKVLVVKGAKNLASFGALATFLPNVEHLFIEKCPKLRSYEPSIKDFSKLCTYRNGLISATLKDNTLNISN